MSTQFRYDWQSETVSYSGHPIHVHWHRDPDCGEPWELCDRQGVVSDWTNRDPYDGEVVIDSDKSWRRYFDKHLTLVEFMVWEPDEEKAQALVDEACERARAWCADEWMYMYAQVTVPSLGFEGGGVGGIESDYAGNCLDDVVCEAKSHIDRHQRNLVMFVRLMGMG